MNDKNISNRFFVIFVGDGDSWQVKNRAFPTYADAERYAKTISPTRMPRILEDVTVVRALTMPSQYANRSEQRRIEMQKRGRVIKKGGPDALNEFRPGPHKKGGEGTTADDLMVSVRNRGEGSIPF